MIIHLSFNQSIPTKFGSCPLLFLFYILMILYLSFQLLSTFVHFTPISNLGSHLQILNWMTCVNYMSESFSQDLHSILDWGSKNLVEFYVSKGQACSRWVVTNNFNNKIVPGNVSSPVHHIISCQDTSCSKSIIPISKVTFLTKVHQATNLVQLKKLISTPKPRFNKNRSLLQKLQ